MNDIKNQIENEIKNNDVVLFIKGTPERPECGFSKQVIEILDKIGCPYKSVNVMSSNDLRQGVKEYSNWPTLPQLYIKSTFIGGCDIVREMFKEGELQDLLNEKGIALKGASS